MRGYNANIEEDTIDNNDFRRVLYSGKYMQLVLMSLLPNQEIGMEVHPDNDQFFRFEEGSGRVVIDENSYDVADGSVIIVPAGAKHNVINMSDSQALKLYTIYAPPHHKDGIVRVTKAEAMADEADFDGATSE